MNTVTNTKANWRLPSAAIALIALLPWALGCAPESTDEGEATTAPAAVQEDDHGHEHAEGDDHGHEHAATEDNQGHEHAEADDDRGHTHDGEEHADEDLTTVDGVLHAIAKTHGTLETATTDQQLLDAHHAPFEIEELFTKLRPMLELSEEDAAKYDQLHAKIGQQADLIEKHSHDNEVEMVRTLVEKLNADIEALEKIAAPNHVH